MRSKSFAGSVAPIVSGKKDMLWGGFAASQHIFNFSARSGRITAQARRDGNSDSDQQGYNLQGNRQHHPIVDHSETREG